MLSFERMFQMRENSAQYFNPSTVLTVRQWQKRQVSYNRGQKAPPIFKGKQNFLKLVERSFIDK